MAVLMATGHAVQIPMSLIDSVRTLTANIAAELGEAPAGSVTTEYFSSQVYCCSVSPSW
jgi:phosphate transport system permease protein